MRTQRIVLALALSIAATGAAKAQEYRGTWEQQMACTPDVWRLCSEHVPDTGRIVSCLRQNTPNLSSGCRAVFETNAQQEASRAAPRARSAPSPQYQQPQYRQPQYQQPIQPQYRQPGPYIEDDED
ncbi:cysteine rich repeat-containing protein [Bradyrhizobium lablabi]|uniref:cysteine rich repeat-containing protein n=1 Tax=Bradyrhizobium lablabi TaxID=722472 RepID=UPI002011287B|nr:cysteine rich repeat-containing protein [Bradyrhizobium lablabi]